MRVLLLGAGGFVGSHLAERLVADDVHDVVGVDLTSEKVAHVGGSRWRFVHGDIRHLDDTMRGEVAAADVVVDLVAYANPSIYVSAPLDVVDLNFTANLAVLESCVATRTRLVQYSSAEIYGKFAEGAEGRVGEDHADLIYGPVERQRWIYACAKQLLERIVHAHGARGDLDYTIIRPFNFIGPRLDYLVEAGARGGPRVFAHFLSALLSGGPMQLVDGGHVHRSFCAVEDATEAAVAILDQPQRVRNETFNIGNPDNNVTIRELATTMRRLWTELTDETPAGDVVDVSGSDFYGLGYEDADRLPPAVGKLADAVGWSPHTGLSDTLRSTMRWYLEHPQAVGAAA